MDRVRTVSDSKRDFYTYHTRPINSIYRRVVEELLVEMHLLSVNVDFIYDPIYALGVFTSFERFMQGYQPENERDSIFYAICKSVGGDANQYRRDAEHLLAAAKQVKISDLIANLESSDPYHGDNFLIQSLKAIANAAKFKYSRLFAVGIYTALIESDVELVKEAEQRNQFLAKICGALRLPQEKIQKDLELYRSNLEKIEQLLTVMEEALEAERKKREQKEQQKQETVS